MNLALKVFLLINTIFIALFVLGREVIFKLEKRPKLHAGYAVILGVFFFPYFLAIVGIVLFSVFKQEFLPVCLVLFIFVPFLIGQKATYEKLNFYSNMQLASFLGSAAFALVLLKQF